MFSQKNKGLDVIIIFNIVKNTTIKIKRFFLDNLKNNIKYNIIDVDDEKIKNRIWFLCNRTKTVFYRKLSDGQIEMDVIGHLKSEEACFLGILTGQYLWDNGLNNHQLSFSEKNKIPDLNQSAKDFNNIAFDRYGNLIYRHSETGLICSDSAINIASDRSKIEQFSSEASYFIGVHVGYRINRSNNTKTVQKLNLSAKGHLTLVISR